MGNTAETKGCGRCENRCWLARFAATIVENVEPREGDRPEGDPSKVSDLHESALLAAKIEAFEAQRDAGLDAARREIFEAGLDVEKEGCPQVLDVYKEHNIA